MLLLDFHGFESSDTYIANHDGVLLAAEKEGFIVLYPDGSKDYRNGVWWNNWNGGGTNASRNGKYGPTCMKDHPTYPCYRSCAKAGQCKNNADRTDCGCSGCADDLGFIDLLIKKVKHDMCIDETRVHGTGMSNGAIF